MARLGLLGVVSCWLLCPFGRTRTFLIFRNTLLPGITAGYSRSLAPSPESAASRALYFRPRPGLCSHSLICEHQPLSAPARSPRVRLCGPCQATTPPPRFLPHALAPSSWLSSAACFLEKHISSPAPSRATQPACLMQAHSLGHWGPPLPGDFFYICCRLFCGFGRFRVGCRSCNPTVVLFFPGPSLCPQHSAVPTPGHSRTGLWALLYRHF